MVQIPVENLFQLSISCVVSTSGLGVWCFLSVACNRFVSLTASCLHTGLGPSGLGERIFACADDAAAFARAKAWWGQGITSIYDGSSTSAFLTGLMWMAAYQECPQAEYTGIAMEYGTQAQLQVMQALRGDHWLQLHSDAPEALRQQIKQDLMDAFYVDTDEWRTQIVDQAMDAMHQAVTGLNN